MYRVYDIEKKCWLKNNIYLSLEGDLFLLKKSFFGKKLIELSNDEYVYHKDIGLYDKDNDLIFEGDYLKAKVSDDRTVIGLVAFAQELSAYIILCYDTNEFFTLGTEVCEYVEIIGNVIENKNLLSTDYTERE